MSKSIVFFTKYSRMGASSRLRTFQFLPLYELEGYSITVSPLFSDKYLKRLYAKKSVFIQAFWGYLKRFFSLYLVFTNKIIIIEKELFPYLPAWVERFMNFLGLKFYVDYDDAIFVTYEKKYPKPLRNWMKNKIKYVMNSAKGVVVGNSFLAQYATKAKADNIVVIPTVVDTDRYTTKLFKTDDKIIVIGWIGSPTTAPYVEKVIPVLEDISQRYGIIFRMVGAKINYRGLLPIEFIPWTEATEVLSIQSFDIGLMPLEENEWARGKCAYKLIQYMACGIPSIGSNFGANQDVINHEKSGFLVSNDDDWKASIKKLINNELIRKQVGLEGRKIVEKDYSLTSAFEKWKKLINE